MNVLLMTSIPLTPPWDQGDKNLAYGLAHTMRAARFMILTEKGSEFSDDKNLVPLPFFLPGKSGLLSKSLVILKLIIHKREIQAKGQVDLIHLLYRPYRLSAWVLRALRRIYAVPVIQTIPATRDGRYLGRDLFISDHVVTLSEYGRQKLKQLGIRDVIAVPPGVCIDHWQQVGAETDRYKKMLSVEGRPVVFFPGHFGDGMGADTIIEAIPRVVSEIPDVLVIFACRIRSHAERIKEEDARRSFANSKLASNVRFYQTIEHMEPFIGASDLVALPLQSMRDKLDLPSTLIEFMAAGKAMVISDLAPMNEILAAPTEVDRGAGVLVSPGDSRALSNAIVMLLKDSFARKKIGRRAQELTCSRFDIRKVAQQYQDLYQKALAG